MKRSELLKRIEEYLVCDGVTSYSYPPHEVKFSDRHIEMMAKDIVELIEEAGMLPPKTRNSKLPINMNRCELADEQAKYLVYGYEGPYYDMEYDVNEWEPEE